MILKSNQKIILSEKDFLFFLDKIENPSKPSENLIKASQDYINFLNEKKYENL